jgi:NADPH-dependent 2,4-dienoyl-CoA reductase/sulfur reductase-like enzyme/rhodanese-related sulfurtransferase
MKLLIIGGVAGGAAAAARARRLKEDAEIIMIDRGEFISFANCGLPYYAGNVIPDRKALFLQTPEGFRKRFRIDVRTSHNALSIDRKKKSVTIEDLNSRKVYEETYDYLILSPGAEPFLLDIPGAGSSFVHTARTIPDIDRIKSELDSGRVKKAVVIGAGYIGLEMAENLSIRGIETHVVEKLGQILPVLDKEMAAHFQRLIRSSGISIHCSEQVTAIKEIPGKGCAVHTASGKKLTADIVIMSIGVRPETALAEKAGLKTGRSGIAVDPRMRTSDEFIFAVGDAAEVAFPVTGRRLSLPLAGPAAKQARVAADTIFGLSNEYKGTYGTSIVKISSHAAAVTGASERVLKSENIPYKKIYIFPPHHASYYPGAAQMAIKLLYSPDGGNVLGAQVIGQEGTDKRADLFSAAVKHRLTVKDLAEMELCYAPPFGSAKDPVNMAGMVAQNEMQGNESFIHWEDLTGTELLLDVRTEKENKMSPVPEAINIPVDELRERLAEIPEGRTLAVFCAVGVRAHIACRMLVQKGFKASNISGGFISFLNLREASGHNQAGTTFA